MGTGLVWDERYMWHDSGNQFGPPSPWVEPTPHLESAEGKRRIKNLLDASGLSTHLTPIAARPATDAELGRAHTAEYIAYIRETSERGGGNIAARATTHIGKNGYEIAALAAGGAMAAVDAVIDGTVENAYALIRPPGHHAEPGEGKGFCVFGNAALAALHAIEAHGLERVAIVDWDAHHGNGTQAIFWEDPRVLTISLHQDGVFPPGSGPETDVGEGAGRGFNINIPLPGGSGEGAYVAALERIVVPALRKFGPALIVVACGFDAGLFDPLARMSLTSESFRRMAQIVKLQAHETCGGRLVMVHEGGYSLHSVPFHALAVLECLSGTRTDVADPFLPPGGGPDPVLPHQAAVIDRVADVLASLG